ncbi:chaplin family protein [Arthrobacter silvisoli]|uniref:chaplin family protein n=1 Tax=Arthrobacter silvisoli TaxID=2291022 RepID=UPI000E218C07
MKAAQSRIAASETTATNPAGGVPSGDQVVAPIAVPVNIGATMLTILPANFSR